MHAKIRLSCLLSAFMLHVSTLSALTDWMAYVVDNFNKQVIPVDASIGLIIPTAFPVGIDPRSIAITPDGTKAYVVNHGTAPNTQSVTQLDLPSGNTGATITFAFTPGLGAGLQSIAITPDGTTAYVTGTGRLYAIDIASNQVTGSILVPGLALAEIAITPDGTRAYLTAAASIKVCSLIGAGSLVATIPAPPSSGNFHGPSITPDGKRLYMVSRAAATIRYVDTDPTSPTYNTFIGLPISVGANPQSLAIVPNGTLGYATTFDGTDSKVVSFTIPEGYVQTSSVVVGSWAQELAITPDSKRVYELNISVDPELPPVNPSIGYFSVGSSDPAILLPFSDTNTLPINLAITPDQAPTARFTASVGEAGLVSFDASASTTPPVLTTTGPSEIVKYFWDFGDGTTTETSSPLITHSYVAGGTYSVTLIVTNTAGTSNVQVFTGQTVSNNGGPSAQLTQQITTTGFGPFSPVNIRGFQIKNEFATQTDRINVIKWQAPETGEKPVAYYIFRDNLQGPLAGVVFANEKLEFLDHNRQKIPYTYAVVGVSIEDFVSAPAYVTINP